MIPNLKFSISALAMMVFLAPAVLAQTPPADAPKSEPPPAAGDAPATPLPQMQPPGGEKKKKESSPCKKEVEAAFEKQRKSSALRMEASMVNTEGPVTMSVDYVLPSRMYQKTTATLTGKVTETILVDGKAWFKSDANWKETTAAEASQIIEQVENSVVNAPEDVGEFSCNGKVNFEGRDYVTYVAEDPNSTQKNTAPYRMLYVDPTTGLPMRSIYTLPGKEDKPFFKTTWSYPIDLKIEPPQAK